MLRQLQAIEIPNWLTDLTPESIQKGPLPIHALLSESLYYPACGFDGDPIRHFRGNVLSFVYSDYGYAQEVLMPRLRFSGYDLLAHRFLSTNGLSKDGYIPLEIYSSDGNPSCYIEYIKEPYCVWAVFQRCADTPSTVGPTRFSLLCICADGVETFHQLYIANGKVPKAVAIIQPGHAFGLNWTDFTKSDAVTALFINLKGDIAVLSMASYLRRAASPSVKPPAIT